MKRRVSVPLGLLAIGAGVLSLSLFFYSERISERWYLWRLRSAPSQEERMTAAVHLSKTGSERVVLPILEQIDEIDRSIDMDQDLFYEQVFDVGDQLAARHSDELAELLKANDVQRSCCYECDDEADFESED